MSLKPQNWQQQILPMLTAALLLWLLCVIILFQDLSGVEASMGMLTRSINEDGNYFSSNIQGIPTSSSFGYPWAAALLSFNSVSLFTLRLPSLFFLIGCGALAFFSAKKQGGARAGWAGFLIVISSFGALQKGIIAEDHLGGAFFMSAAWLTFYYYGVQQKQWFKAWLYGLFCTGLAATFGGLTMFVFFYLPIFFLNDLFSLRKRLFHAPHLRALAALFLAGFIFQSILSWRSPDPESSYTLLNIFTRFSSPEFQSGYFRHLLNFPFNCAFYFMPWTLVSWTCFCEGWKLLEKPQNLFTFLRRICLCVFFAVYLWPDSSPYTLIPLIVPLGIMSGIHFDIILRRHEALFERFLRPLSLILLSAAAIFAFMFYQYNKLFLSPWQDYMLPAALQLILLAGICCSLILVTRQRRALVCHLALLSISIVSLHMAVRWSPRDKNRIKAPIIARKLNKIIPAEKTLYNFTGEELNEVLFHLKSKTQRIPEENKNKLPGDDIYVLAQLKSPITIYRDNAYYSWQQLTVIRLSNGRQFALWHGKKAL